MARAHESESATTSALSPTRYAHEERVLRTPHDVEAWCDYLDAIDAGDENDDDDDASRAIDRYMIYERAIKHNAHSYKLWYRYLTERARRDSKTDDRLSVCDSSIRLRATPLPGPEGPSLVIVTK